VGEIDADELLLLDPEAELELLPALPPLRRTCSWPGWCWPATAR
jgi:hypothetical protein